MIVTSNMRTASGLLVIATILLSISATVAVRPTTFQADFTPKVQSNKIIKKQQVFTMKAGDLVNITLSENPTTGYVWVYKNPFKNLTGLYSVETDQSIQPPTQDGEPQMPGAPSFRNIILKAERGGAEDFELILVRSWEL